jgi:probable rRNA maturation factor
MTVTVCHRHSLRPVDARRVKQIAGTALRRAGAAPNCQLNIALVDDATITALNRRFHQTDAPTDVLSFDYGDGLAELIISVEHALTQAGRFRSTPSRELALYIIHGILHLHGYDDRTPRSRARMRAAERRLLNEVTFTGLVSAR